MRSARRLTFLLLLGLALACPVAQAKPYGLDARQPIGPFLNNVMPETAPGLSGSWKTVKAFPNLTFQDPTFFCVQPGTNRLYVCGREGFIWYFENDPNVSEKKLFLDLHWHVQGWDDCGILGMVFHPEFGKAASTNRGYVYVWYQYTRTNILGSADARPPLEIPTYNRLSRFTVPDGSLEADPDSETILINQFDRHLWHSGGEMFFAKDGFLYLPNGDEGGAKDPYDQCQKINDSLFSGVLRIDVDQNPTRSHPIRRQPKDPAPPPAGWLHSFTTNYFIPNDNPWVNADGSVLEEFWAIGLRSPHRMTYDPPTGQIWLGDVGQEDREEIDLIEKAGNYQWSYMEGTLAGFRPKPKVLIGIEKPPVYDYPHNDNDGCVICGHVYRGKQWAADLGGKLIFGDNDSGKIWALTYNGPDKPPTVAYICNMPPGMNYAGGLSSFGLDDQNEIYMCAMGQNGQIFKLAGNNTVIPEPPKLLSQVGLFTNMATLSAASGLVPYNVNAPLWSDAAIKTRWIALAYHGDPNNTNEQIAFAPDGEWTFPAGTVFVKHFDLAIDETNPAKRRRLETRLLVRDNNDSVYGVTYKWRPDNSDAELITSTNSVSEDITISCADGKKRTQTWIYPSRRDCLTCHTPNAHFVLGVKTRQLNGECTYSETGRTDNQLRTWNHLHMFSPALEESTIQTYDALANLTNTAASVEDRSRSYLDVNCSHCHRPGAVQAHWDARYDTPLPNQGIVKGLVNNTFGVPNAKVVAISNIDHSILYLRLNADKTNKMPPLGRNLVDTNAVSVIGQWINSIVPTPPLPAPWNHEDIGHVGLKGSAVCQAESFTIGASGTDIWGLADEFHYVYRPMSGDGEMVARVVRMRHSDEWAKSGVMIRETLEPGSKYAHMFASADFGPAFECRLATDAKCSGGATNIVLNPPYYVKVARKGTTFTGSYSKDGTDWKQFGAAMTIPMEQKIYIGLAVTAHNNGAVNQAIFDRVKFETLSAMLLKN
jgi:uncharacterized repeat protein (TIGR03806 family)